MNRSKILLTLLVTISSYNLIAQKLTGGIGMNYGIMESLIKNSEWNEHNGVQGQINYHFNAGLALGMDYQYRVIISSFRSSTEANSTHVWGLFVTKYFNSWNKGFSASAGIHSSYFDNVIIKERKQKAIGFSLSAAYGIALGKRFSIKPKYSFMISSLVAETKKVNSHLLLLSLEFVLFGE